MSCSSIFSDLPELVYEIIKYFRNDFSTLHSCILVNRLWCRLAIPLLWEDPFSISKVNCKFVEIYLHNLNEEDLKIFKSNFNKYEIKNYLLPSNTLFNYPSFIKYLNTSKITSSVHDWIYKIAYETIEFEFIAIRNMENLITKSLCKLFFENRYNLYTLDIVINSYFCQTFFKDFLELISRNQNFFHNIKNSKLQIEGFTNHLLRNNNNTLVNKYLLQTIKSQKNLKRILFGSDDIPLCQQLLLLKNSSNCTNTLNTIIFYYVNLSSIINLKEVFEQLNVLESVHIVSCSSFNDSFIKQIINLTKPFKLKSLFISETLHISETLQVDSLQSLLQKSGDYLENFGFGLRLFNRQSLELIIKYCNNIKFYTAYSIDDYTVYPMINLIEKQNLNYLSIDIDEFLSGSCCIESYAKRSSVILQNLGQILPSKLEYLNLTLYIKANDFEIFLKNSQNTFIKKLLIDNKEGDNMEVILPYIKEHIMRKKRAMYLAIMRDAFVGSTAFDVIRYKDLYDSNDEVKEFRLHNIKVQRYFDLIISVSNFIQEID